MSGFPTGMMASFLTIESIWIGLHLPSQCHPFLFCLTGLGCFHGFLVSVDLVDMFEGQGNIVQSV